MAFKKNEFKRLFISLKAKSECAQIDVERFVYLFILYPLRARPSTSSFSYPSGKDPPTVVLGLNIGGVRRSALPSLSLSLCSVGMSLAHVTEQPNTERNRFWQQSTSLFLFVLPPVALPGDDSAIPAWLGHGGAESVCIKNKPGGSVTSLNTSFLVS